MLHLPDHGYVPMTIKGAEDGAAYLIRFTEDLDFQLREACREKRAVTIVKDAGLSLHISGQPPIPLEAHTTGNATEICLCTAFPPAIKPMATANARLTVPFTAQASARAADKLSAQTKALEKEKKLRADRVNGVARKEQINGPSKNPVSSIMASATGMARTQSTPTSSPYLPATPANGAPIIPLKTRVMQVLAMGEIAFGDLLRRVGGAEHEVRRVAVVIGKVASHHPETFILDPAQYAKIRFAGAKYTYAEKHRVAELARKAFKQLGYGSDAEEYQELERKLEESFQSSSTSSGNSATSDRAPYTAASSSSTPTVAATPELATPASARSVKSNGDKKPATTTKSPATTEKKDKTPQTKVGKQIAKFRAETLKRPTSLPNVKSEGGLASPRLPPVAVLSGPMKVKGTKEKQLVETNDEDRKQRVKMRKRDSYDYTSSEDERDHAGDKLAFVKNGDTTGKASSKPVVDRLLEAQMDPDGAEKSRGRSTVLSTKRERDPETSLSPDSEPRGRPAKRLSPTPLGQRKSRPSDLHLNGNGHATPTVSTNGNIAKRSMDELQERYEEILPAYTQLSARLTGLHRINQGVRIGGEDELDTVEIEKLTARWQRWHKELLEITSWLDASAH